MIAIASGFSPAISRPTTCRLGASDATHNKGGFSQISSAYLFFVEKQTLPRGRQIEESVAVTRPSQFANDRVGTFFWRASLFSLALTSPSILSAPTTPVMHSCSPWRLGDGVLMFFSISRFAFLARFRPARPAARPRVRESSSVPVATDLFFPARKTTQAFLSQARFYRGEPRVTPRRRAWL